MSGRFSLRIIFLTALCLLVTAITQDNKSAILETINTFVFHELAFNSNEENQCPAISNDTTIVFVGNITRVNSPISYHFTEPDFDFTKNTSDSGKTREVVLAGLNVEKLTISDNEELKKFLRLKLLNRDDIRLEVNTKAFRQDSLVLHGEIFIGENSLNFSLLRKWTRNV